MNRRFSRRRTMGHRPVSRVRCAVLVDSQWRKQMIRLLVAAAVGAGATGLLLGGWLSTQARGADWPGFRGADGSGIAAGEKPPTEWGKDKNIRWRTELKGTGNSSPIVIEGRVFVTVARDEGAKRNLICFDRQTGKE
ncbi:MAG: hypothetical protein KDA79_15975, partial [Planctomycetaceae bacterium]|nr:hypothetical protein [Planctomycetaceae bacterium]